MYCSNQDLRKGEVRAIGALSIPALDSSADGADYYCQIESARNSPFVMCLCMERITLFLGELMLSGSILVVLRVLCDQRLFLQQVGVLGKHLSSAKSSTCAISSCFGTPAKGLLILRSAPRIAVG